jgi:acetyl-CoA carboxylase biotin carboxylase subunit
VSAIRTLRDEGVQCVPGSDGPLSDEVDRNLRIAKQFGYPVII